MYHVTTDQHSQPQIEALPAVALGSFAEVRAMLEVAPSGGEPLNDSLPDGPVRSLAFGPDRLGLLTYLILDRERRVDILDVVWIG